MKNNNFILGTKKSFPIIIGYIPVAITFGILCKSMNLPLIYVFCPRLFYIQEQHSLCL